MTIDKEKVKEYNRRAREKKRGRKNNLSDKTIQKRVEYIKKLLEKNNDEI